MKKNFSLTLVAQLFVLLLAACTSTAHYEHQLDYWIGKTDTQLVSAWGIPDKQYQLNETTKLVSYVAHDTVSYPGTSFSTCFGAGMGNALFNDCGAFPPSTQSLNCETIFTLVKGRVTRWGHKGNYCRS
jgi:hypothetical protein